MGFLKRLLHRALIKPDTPESPQSQDAEELCEEIDLTEDIEEHIETNPHVSQHPSDFVFDPIPIAKSELFTEKEYAHSLIESAKNYAGKINNSTNVFDFVVAYKMIKQTLEKLAWLNEERNIFMYPTPRSDFQKIYDNMENTINDFIFRSMGRIKKAGGEWNTELKKLFDEMENDSCLSGLMTGSNREQIQQIREQLKANPSVDKPPIKVTEDIHNAAMAVFEANSASVSMLQRRFKLGYTHAAYLTDCLERAEIIGPFNGTTPRKVLMSKTEYMDRYQIVDELDPFYQEKQSEIELEDLSVDINFDQILRDEVAWRREQMDQSPIEHELDRIDKMDGHTFERWCASLLEASGFKDVEVTRGSGDQGVDVLATMDGVRYAVQCKCYASDLGNKPVQEVYAGIAIYKCQLGSVITNRHFTPGAKELAEATGIVLWDRDWIISLLEELGDDALPL